MKRIPPLLAIPILSTLLSGCVFANKEGYYSGFGAKTFETSLQRVTFVGIFDNADLTSLTAIVEPGTECRGSWPLPEGSFLGCATETRK